MHIPSIILAKRSKLILASALFIFSIGSLVVGVLLMLHNGNSNSNTKTSTNDKDANAGTHASGVNKDSTEPASNDNKTLENNAPAVLNEKPEGAKTTPTPSSPNSSAKTYTVEYNDWWYTPALLEIKKGDTVKFVNKSDHNMWPITDPPLTNQFYPEFNAGKPVPPQGVFNFTFKKKGFWSYYDKITEKRRGNIVVK